MSIGTVVAEYASAEPYETRFCFPSEYIIGHAIDVRDSCFGSAARTIHSLH